MLRREPVTIETQSGWREAFAPATGSRIWGGRPWPQGLKFSNAEFGKNLAC